MPHDEKSIELPEPGGTNVVGNPLWVIDTAEVSIIEGDKAAGDGAGGVRIQRLLGVDFDGTPKDPDQVEAAGLALVAAARAARITD